MIYTPTHLLDALVEVERLRHVAQQSDQAERKARALATALAATTLLGLEAKSKDARKLVYALRGFIGMLADLRSPFDGIMEGTIPLPELMSRADAIEHQVETLKASCYEAALLLVHALVPGMRESVSSNELVAAGYDDSTDD
jgi:hypothetical protein